MKKIIEKIKSWRLMKNQMLKRRIVQLEKQLGDPRFVVEKVLDRGIVWYNAQDSTKEHRRKYYAEAQQILNSDVFNNLINFLIATQCQEQVRQYNPQIKYNPIRDVQMMINAFELLREELESITDPEKEPSLKNDSDILNPFSLV